MPAQKPQRPAPGHALHLPRVGADPAGNTVQRALDAVQTTTQQVQRTVAANESAGGRLLAPPLLLTGIGTGTLPAGTAVIKIRGIGQGGGGGGATGTVAAGAGGSSGEVVEATIGTPGTPLPSSYSWVGGAAGGAGGSAAGGAGAAGAASTFTANSGVTYTASGGGGGGGMVGVMGNANVNPTATATGTPAVGTAGVMRRTYASGLIGEAHDGTMWFSGAGGSTDFGAGGLSIGGASDGLPGGGMGAGGGGAATNGAGHVGGAGAPGGWIVEFYS